MKIDKDTYHLRYRAISNGMKFLEMPWGDVTVSGKKKKFGHGVPKPVKKKEPE